MRIYIYAASSTASAARRLAAGALRLNPRARVGLAIGRSRRYLRTHSNYSGVMSATRKPVHPGLCREQSRLARAPRQRARPRIMKSELLRDFGRSRRGLARERVNASETAGIFAKSPDLDRISDAVALAVAGGPADADQTKSTVHVVLSNKKGWQTGGLILPATQYARSLCKRPARFEN